MAYNGKKCQRCNESVDIHKKCIDCGILLHEEREEYQGEGGIQHTLEVKKGRCAGCSRG